MNPMWLNYDLVKSDSTPTVIYFISGLFAKTIEEFFFHSQGVLKLAKRTKQQYVVSAVHFWPTKYLVCATVTDCSNQVCYKCSFMLIQLPLKCYSDIVSSACVCGNVSATVCRQYHNYSPITNII